MIKINEDDIQLSGTKLDILSETVYLILNLAENKDFVDVIREIEIDNSVAGNISQTVIDTIIKVSELSKDLQV